MRVISRVQDRVEQAMARTPSVVKVENAADTVVLTYDDGPEPGGTEGVLSALADRGATATFFVLISRVRLYPSLLAEVVAAGHEIGLHGLDHRPLTTFSHADVRQRTLTAKNVLEDVVGAEVRWVRPPYGRQTRRTWQAVDSVGLRPVMWSASTWDSADLLMSERLAKAQVGVVGGMILLAHDGHADERDGVDDGPAFPFDRGSLTKLTLETYLDRGLVGRSLGDALLTGSVQERSWIHS